MNKSAGQKEEVASATEVQAEVQAPEVVIEPEDTLSDYMSFADAAKKLDVRFQQVYQRAVVRNKMRWIDAGKRKMVHKADVAAWAAIRREYFSAKA